MAEMTTMLTFSKDVKDAEKPKPLPAGQYKAISRAAEQRLSGKGKKYIAVQLHVSPEQYPADYANEGNPEGTTLTWGKTSGEDTPQGRWSVKKLFEAFGAPLPGREVDLNSLLGREVVMTVKTGNYQGEDTAEIDKISKV